MHLILFNTTYILNTMILNKNKQIMAINIIYIYILFNNSDYQTRKLIRDSMK